MKILILAMQNNPKINQFNFKLLIKILIYLKDSMKL